MSEMRLVVRSLGYVHPDKVRLFTALSFGVAVGERVALVGNNGMGKSTLVKVLAGLVAASEGAVILSGRSWYVPQHFGQYDVLTIGQALGVDTKLAALAAIMRGETDMVWYASLDEDWGIQERVAAALAGWGLSGLSMDRLLGDLSGGEKTKVYLAGIEIHYADFVILDEPSNHLDVSGRRRLYELVDASGATMLIISHDRMLLNMVDRTLELSGSGIESYGGNYEFYRAVKDGKVNALQAQLDEQEKVLRQSRQKAREMMQQRQKSEARGRAAAAGGGLPRIIAGGLASKAERSTAKLMDTHSEKMSGIHEQIQQIRDQIDEQTVLKIGLDPSDLHRGKVLVRALEVGFDYGGVSLWEPLSFEIRSGDRLRIVGDNGSGKTTLLRIIAGSMAPSSGELFRASFGFLYLDQDYSIIDAGLTVYEQVMRYNSRYLQEHELKSLLVHFQFSRDAWDRSCAGLSGGEKMKLALACMSAGSETYDVLILDEPTNNLDMTSLAVLTEAVRAFAGTLIVVSHDQYFADAIDLRQVIDVRKRNH